MSIEVPKERRKWKEFIEIRNLTENNLKNITVKFPINVLTCITGVSGSGKSTLIKRGLIPTLQKYLNGYFDSVNFDHLIGGSLKQIKQFPHENKNPV